jgi:hypothetical protein
MLMDFMHRLVHFAERVGSLSPQRHARARRRFDVG